MERRTEENASHLFALMRGRELKLCRDGGDDGRKSVRPHARAGVEISLILHFKLPMIVRPHARAGVEMALVRAD